MEDRVFNFYGVSFNYFKLDDAVWEAVEDPNDGYRSYLGAVLRISEAVAGTFSHDPIAQVKVAKSGKENNSDFQLVDVADGHVWLSVGTDYTDNYYPCFYFTYTPKPRPRDPNNWNDFVSPDW